MAPKLLKSASIAELQAQLELKRKEEAELPMPHPLEKPDFSVIVKMAENYIKDLQFEEFYDEDNDKDHWFYEEAMKAVYGPNIFKYVNAKNKLMGR